eukprot:Opistho-2@40761
MALLFARDGVHRVSLGLVLLLSLCAQPHAVRAARVSTYDGALRSVCIDAPQDTFIIPGDSSCYSADSVRYYRLSCALQVSSSQWTLQRMEDGDSTCSKHLQYSVSGVNASSCWRAGRDILTMVTVDCGDNGGSGSGVASWVYSLIGVMAAVAVIGGGMIFVQLRYGSRFWTSCSCFADNAAEAGQYTPLN